MDGPLNVSTTFLKQPSSGYGGDWAISMHVSHNEQAGAAAQAGKLAELQPVYVYIGQEYEPQQGGGVGLQDWQFEAPSEWGITVRAPLLLAPPDLLPRLMIRERMLKAWVELFVLVAVLALGCGERASEDTCSARAGGTDSPATADNL